MLHHLRRGFVYDRIFVFNMPLITLNSSSVRNFIVFRIFYHTLHSIMFSILKILKLYISNWKDLSIFYSHGNQIRNETRGCYHKNLLQHLVRPSHYKITTFHPAYGIIYSSFFAGGIHSTQSFRITMRSNDLLMTRY